MWYRKLNRKVSKSVEECISRLRKKGIECWLWIPVWQTIKRAVHNDDIEITVVMALSLAKQVGAQIVRTTVQKDLKDAISFDSMKTL